MPTRLQDIFEGIAPPRVENPEKPLYAVMEIPGYSSYFIGKDREGHACLLVATEARAAGLAAPIRLESLDVQFNLRCHVRRGKEPERVGVFTVIRCRSLDDETARYFLSICDIIVGMVGDRPKQQAIATAVHRLAAIFQKMQKPAARPVNGLFGELYFIWRSANPSRTVTAWRVDEISRFDFADGNVRVDVKAAGGRLRAHMFSYDQCNPPPGTIAVVASLFVEQSPGGMSLRSLIGEIEAEIAAYPRLVLRMHEAITSALGASLSEALPMAFDIKLADSSLKFYSLREIPGIRGTLPRAVSDVHFRSELSDVPALSIQALLDEAETFRELLPGKEHAGQKS
jgi:hypothetical protein